ncbi:MAG: glycosyltransferase family protein, partial [Phycisphaerae bacterium]
MTWSSVVDDRAGTTVKTPVDSPRVLAYCHDGVGLGHLRRTLNICEHLGAAYRRMTFLVATGNPYVSLFGQIKHADYLKLPSIRKVDNDVYVPKFLQLASERVLRHRESLLLETARCFDPHIVLVDKAPLGVCGELVSTLKWIRRRRPTARIVFGMRDIEDEPEATVRQWSKLGVQQMLEEYFDEVWVYGMRNVFDVAREYRLSANIQAKLRFLGYVTRGLCDHRCELGFETDRALQHAREHQSANGQRRRCVLVTVGGGTDGTELLNTYLGEAAVRATAAGASTVIVSGPDFPRDDASVLRGVAAAIPNVEWIEFARCMRCLIRQADLVVCMGGYNTLCEVAHLGKNALVV